jgi:hypothetical protein
MENNEQKDAPVNQKPKLKIDLKSKKIRGSVFFIILALLAYRGSHKNEATSVPTVTTKMIEKKKAEAGDMAAALDSLEESDEPDEQEKLPATTISINPSTLSSLNKELSAKPADLPTSSPQPAPKACPVCSCPASAVTKPKHKVTKRRVKPSANDNIQTVNKPKTKLEKFLTNEDSVYDDSTEEKPVAPSDGLTETKPVPSADNHETTVEEKPVAKPYAPKESVSEQKPLSPASQPPSSNPAENGLDGENTKFHDWLSEERQAIEKDIQRRRADREKANQIKSRTATVQAIEDTGVPAAVEGEDYVPLVDDNGDLSGGTR